MFECGLSSMTRQFGEMNLDAVVVGRDGRGYLKESWNDSHTFRSGEQGNLLIADNRTRDFEESTRGSQTPTGPHHLGAVTGEGLRSHGEASDRPEMSRCAATPTDLRPAMLPGSPRREKGVLTLFLAPPHGDDRLASWSTRGGL